MRGGRAARARLAKRKYTKCFRLILKSKGNARHFFFKYFWRTDGRATGGAEPNATRNWCFVEADGVYFYCFSMIVQSFAEATTDTIWVFHFLTKQAFCAHRLSTLAQSDDKQTRGGKGEHEKALVKMHTKRMSALPRTFTNSWQIDQKHCQNPFWRPTRFWKWFLVIFNPFWPPKMWPHKLIFLIFN